MDKSISASEKLNNVLPEFQNSLSEAFETMVFLNTLHGEPLPKDDHFPVGAISATIGLTGDDLKGQVTLIFSKKAAELAFRGMMMMSEEDPVNESELKDSIGELANMTAGGAKARLQKNNLNFVISLPTVVIGTDHHLENPKGCASTVIPVSIGEDDTFFMELSIR